MTDLFADDAAWDAARKAVLAKLPALLAYKGRPGTSAQTLAAAMTLDSDIGRMAGRVFAYASLKRDEDLRVPAGQERIAQSRDMGSAVGEASAWLAPELLTIDKAKPTRFIAADKTLATRFDFALANTLREAAHTLTPEAEALLAGASAAFAGANTVRGQLVAADMPWPTITLSGSKAISAPGSIGPRLHPTAR